MKYEAETDSLRESDFLINGESEILKGIAGNVREWAGNWDAVWDNISLRAKIKERLVVASDEAKDPNLLEAEFVVASNDQFHKICERVREEVGALDSERIYFEWESWLKTAVTKKKFL
jgi:hypothetical protein